MAILFSLDDSLLTLVRSLFLRFFVFGAKKVFDHMLVSLTSLLLNWPFKKKKKRQSMLQRHSLFQTMIVYVVSHDIKGRHSKQNGGDDPRKGDLLVIIGFTMLIIFLLTSDFWTSFAFLLPCEG